MALNAWEHVTLLHGHDIFQTLFSIYEALLLCRVDFCDVEHVSPPYQGYVHESQNKIIK